LPIPLPEVIVIQVTFAVAFHSHPGVAVMLTLADPPELPKEFVV
jgi:hypothetical protein